MSAAAIIDFMACILRRGSDKLPSREFLSVGQWMMKTPVPQGGIMTSSQPHYAARRAVALTCGLFALSYMRQRRWSRRLPARSPLANLDARQAMTALKIAHIISVVAMAVYASYYVDAMMQFWVPQ